MRIRHILLAVAAGLALADASIVTLALPQLLAELDTTVEGVASILGVYTVVLAATLLPVERLQRVYGAPRTGAVGLALFAIASVAAGASDSLGMLLAARAVQAVGGAAALVAAFALLEPGGAAGARGRRLWLGAAVLAAAIGPALGGALTEALSWRWIFFAQAPVAAIAAVVALREPVRDTRPRPVPAEGPRLSAGPAIALALVSAALTAVLFLLVLLLVAGWDVSPLHAAVTVTVIPAGALLGSRIGGDARARAAAGCALVGAGVLALAFLPDAHLLWTVVPQAAAGLGMGLALPALGGELLPERDPQDAARLLVLRHGGIALALVVLAPIVSSNLETATERAKERGVAVVLDAQLAPTEKLRLAPVLLAGVDDEEPRHGLRARWRPVAGRSPPTSRPPTTRSRAAPTTRWCSRSARRFARRSWSRACSGLLAAAAVLPRRWTPALAAAAATTLALPLAFVGLHGAKAPEAVQLSDPCKPRALPQTGGLEGFLQDRALEVLDTTACKVGASREELVLALADEQERKRFERRHGVDPRSLSTLLQGLLG